MRAVSSITAILILSAAALISVGTALSAEESQKPQTRLLPDGSSVTLLGTTFGQAHDPQAEHVRDGELFGKLIEDSERVGVWFLRDGGTPREPWGPWVVPLDEHGCRFAGCRWERILLPENATAITHSHSEMSSGTFARGLSGPERRLHIGSTLEATPRHAAAFRVRVYNNDGTAVEFPAASPRRPLAAAWEPAAEPKAQLDRGLSVIADQLVAGLDWDAVRDGSAGIPPVEALPHYLRVVDEPEGVMPWARLRVRLSGSLMHEWSVEAVVVEDRYGNRLTYRHVYQTPVTADGQAWIAFPSSLCLKEPAWKVTVLYAYRGPKELARADFRWTHKDVDAPQRGQTRSVDPDETTVDGVRVQCTGVAARDFGPEKDEHEVLFRAGYRITMPPGETVIPELAATDQDRRPIPSTLFGQTVSTPTREFGFLLTPPPGTRKVSLTLGVWKNRKFSFYLKPGEPGEKERFSETRDAERVASRANVLEAEAQLHAATTGSAEQCAALIRFMREHHIDLSSPFLRKNRTPLMAAVETGGVELARALLAAGADPQRPAYGDTLPILNAAWGNPEVLELLIAGGANVRVPDGGSAPLLSAAANGRVENVRILLGAGSDVNWRNSHGMTALKHARLYVKRHPKDVSGALLIRVLEEAGARE